VRNLIKTNDEGASLGLVLITVTLIGTVLGSVMMVTQLSLESKGESVSQLIQNNVIAQSNSNAYVDLISTAESVDSSLTNSGNTSAISDTNCGIPTQVTHGKTVAKVSCKVEGGTNSQYLTLHVSIQNSEGIKRENNIQIRNSENSSNQSSGSSN
jgi:hypothetical protein